MIESPAPLDLIPPAGVLTFLFTDIEGYSTLERRFGAALQPIMEEHNRIIEEMARECQGYRSRIMGDAFFIVFPTPSEGVRCAVEAQRALSQTHWQVADKEGELSPIEFRVRIGLHTGEARRELREGERADYFGNAVNTAARVSAAAHGGQILISETTRALAFLGIGQDINFRDLGTHRFKGVGETQIHMVEAPGLGREFPPPVTLNLQFHNLPVPLSPLVGRETEAAAWGRELRQSTRLLTLCGFGGLGKTRLALHLAESVVESFPDGVWWIPLDDARSGAEMVRRLAEVLLRELKPQPTVEEQVWEFHRDRDLLLVLDNLEQIPVDEAARVVNGLLRAGSRVRILVTSRVALQMDGEHVKELDALPLKAACTLFTQRAVSRRSSFVLNESNRADVEAICKALDGLPLAIELAAAQVALLSPRQILARLDEVMRPRNTRDSTRPARHVALAAAIDWSYQLLSEDARLLLPRMAVFAGGFTIEAAERLAPPDVDAWDALAELRAHSFLRAQTYEATQQERMSMLEPVRRHSLRLLEADDQGREAKNLHAEFAQELLDHFGQAEATRSEAETLLEIEPEFSNLRAAFLWLTQSDPLQSVHFANVWYRILHARGLWEEAQDVIAKAHAALASLSPRDGGADADEIAELWGELHFAESSLQQDALDLEAARHSAEASLLNYQKSRSEEGQTRALNLLGLLALDHMSESQDEEEKGVLAAQTRAYFNDALTHCPPARHDLRGKVLHNLAMLLNSLDEREEARATYNECLLQRRLAGDERGQAVTLGNLGVLAADSDDLEEAQKFYAQSLEIRRKLDEPFGIALMLHNLGDIALKRGQNERALVLLLHAERLFQQVKSPFAAESRSTLDTLHQTLNEKLSREQAESLLATAKTQSWEEHVAAALQGDR